MGSAGWIDCVPTLQGIAFSMVSVAPLLGAKRAGRIVPTGAGPSTATLRHGG